MKRRVARSKLLSLWRQYTQFQTPQLAPSTIKRDYHKVERIIQRLPDSLTTSVEIRDWLLQHYAAESTRRILMQMNACCQWAVESDLIATNPFTGLGKRIRRKTGQTTWVGFTALERDAIIEQFEETGHPTHVAWVKFLFWTGCRPEEAAGLLWEHITPDDRQIRFCQALPSGIHQQQTTKTGKSRIFPANNRLQGLLKTLRGNHPTRVFSGLRGSFEYHNFQTRQWKPTVTALVESGKVSLYLPQGHCRHTFITLALEYLPVKDVAYLVGNSPEIIYRHYASVTRNLEIPEF